MSRPEDGKSTLDGIIKSGIETQRELAATRLSQVMEAHGIAHAKYLEGLATAEEQRLERVRVAAEDEAKKWAKLEQFDPEGLLEQVNRNQDVWRGLGSIKRVKPTYDGVAVTLSLESKAHVRYDVYGGMYEGEGITSSSVGIGSTSTSLTIGIDIGTYARGHEDEKYLRTAYGLYVYDSSPSLNPVAPADKFSDLPAKKWPEPNLVVIDVDHPQAKDILVELLARSCINRALHGTLPWQQHEMGIEVQREIDLSARTKPVGKQGFLSRIFG